MKGIFFFHQDIATVEEKSPPGDYWRIWPFNKIIKTLFLIIISMNSTDIWFKDKYLCLCGFKTAFQVSYQNILTPELWTAATTTTQNPRSMLKYSWERRNPFKGMELKPGNWNVHLCLLPASTFSHCRIPFIRRTTVRLRCCSKGFSWRNVVAVEKEVLCKSSFKSYPGRNQIDLGILSV